MRRTRAFLCFIILNVLAEYGIQSHFNVILNVLAEYGIQSHFNAESCMYTG